MANKPIGKIVRSSSPEYAENDILIIDSSDVEVFRLYFNEKKPFKCFAASTENINRYELVFKHYVKYHHAPAVPNTWTLGDAAQMRFFTLWEKVVEDFNAASSRSLLANVRRLREVKQTFFPNLDAILNVLELFALNLMVPCLEGSPFCGRDSLNKPRQWTTQSVNWLRTLTFLINRLEHARQAVFPVTVPTIEALLVFVRNCVRAWNQFGQMNAREKCFALSSYTYALAEMFEGRGQYGVSLLLTHRALDLYFNFCAIGASLLVETSNGFEYTGANYGTAVNVLQTFRILQSSGFFAPGLNAESRIRSLNDARNLHLMTHHVYGVEGPDSKALRKSVGSLIMSIEGTGNVRWLNTGGQWLPIPTIDPKCLFETEPSMSTYLAEVL